MRDTTVENYFGAYGITPVYTDTLPLDDIDTNGSLANQARIVAINPETVTTYREAMLRGDDFPAIVVHPGPDGYIILSGNHRTKAREAAKFDTTDAYIVPEGTDRNIMDRFMMTANSVHGLNLTETERLTWVETYLARGLTSNEIAETLNITRSNANALIDSVRGTQRVRRVGLSEGQWDSLSASHRYALNSQRIDDDHFAKLTKLTVKYRPTAHETRAALRAVREGHTSSEKSDLITMWEAELKQAKAANAKGSRTRSGARRPLWADQKMHTAAILKFTPEQVAESITDDETRVFLSEQVDEAIEFFTGLRDSINS